MSVVDWVKRRFAAADRSSFWEWFTRRRRNHDELPAHYSSLVHANHRHYPGHCPQCGTDNEPGYTYCEACGSELPNSGDFGSQRDIATILGE